VIVVSCGGLWACGGGGSSSNNLLPYLQQQVKKFSDSTRF
jgi:hypothetical protein